MATYDSSGTLTTTTKQVDGKATNISVTATLPSNTSADVTVKQDESGAATADSTETVVLTDGTTDVDLTSFTSTSGSTYWLTFSLSTSDDSVTPSIDSATLTVTALFPPTNVMITDSRTEEITVDWDTSGTNADGYYVYRAEVSFTDKSGATQVADVSNPPVTDSGLVKGEEYFYRIASRDGGGNESDLSGEVSGFTPLALFGMETDSGVVNIPVFPIGSSGGNVYEFLRVQTQGGKGYIPLADPSNAAFDFLRINTENLDVLSVHDSSDS